MTARTDSGRSLPDRQHLGAQLRDARNALGMSQRQAARMVGFSQCSVSYVEAATRDVLLSSAVDLAAAVGRVVVVASGHHLPLLDLTADEVETIRDIVALFADRLDAIDTEAAIVASALDKLTTSTEETQP